MASVGTLFRDNFTAGLVPDRDQPFSQRLATGSESLKQGLSP
jgi:hypothetical protein